MNSASASLAPPRARPEIRPGSLAAWSVAMRPKTWWIATIPVLVGSSLAFAETGVFHPAVALLALLSSVVIQAISNLQNDVGYTARGAESARALVAPMLGRQSHGEPLAPLLAPPRQDRAAPHVFHPRPEPMLVDPSPVAWTVCRTHRFPLVRRETYTAARGSVKVDISTGGS